MTRSKLRQRLHEARPDVAARARSPWRRAGHYLRAALRKRGLMAKVRALLAIPGEIRDRR